MRSDSENRVAPKGAIMNSLSPNFQATLDADRKGFAALMRYLKSADAQHTVIMVQVENETGTYGAVRDHSPTAEKLFQQNVPAALLTAAHKGPGNWRQVFGQDADEFFHAWFVARYVDQVAAAGKAETATAASNMAPANPALRKQNRVILQP